MEHSESSPLEESTTLANALIDALDAVLSCSRGVVELAVATFIAGGHLLLEDVPGVGKTTLARALGTAIGGEEMLLYQAMIQVWLMTGIWDNDPPTEPTSHQKVEALEHAMRSALKEAL